MCCSMQYDSTLMLRYLTYSIEHLVRMHEMKVYMMLSNQHYHRNVAHQCMSQQTPGANTIASEHIFTL